MADFGGRLPAPQMPADPSATLDKAGNCILAFEGESQTLTRAGVQELKNEMVGALKATSRADIRETTKSLPPEDAAFVGSVLNSVNQIRDKWIALPDDPKQACGPINRLLRNPLKPGF